MSVNLGIMGFGRLGRNMFRIGYDQPDINFVAVSDIADGDSLAYLLRRSTVEGDFPQDVHLDGRYLVAGKQRTRILHGSRPGEVPWDVLGVDVVIEATGMFRTRPELQKHIDSGAKAVLLSTPPIGEIDRMVVNGVNDNDLQPSDRLVSNASSSCHALAIILKALSEKVGIKRCMMTTVHAYTSDQQLSDSAKPGLRWSRSAAENIIPNESWAPRAVEELLPEMKGKLYGMALNVPVHAGSNIDMVIEVDREISAGELNAMARGAAEGKYKGLLGYTDEPIVSSDVIGNSNSAVFDSQATIALAGGLVKCLVWYDNGWGYAYRLLETARKLAEMVDRGEVAV